MIINDSLEPLCFTVKIVWSCTQSAREKKRQARKWCAGALAHERAQASLGMRRHHRRFVLRANALLGAEGLLDSL